MKITLVVLLVAGCLVATCFAEGETTEKASKDYTEKSSEKSSEITETDADNSAEGNLDVSAENLAVGSGGDGSGGSGSGDAEALEVEEVEKFRGRSTGSQIGKFLFCVHVIQLNVDFYISFLGSSIGLLLFAYYFH